MSRGLCLTKQVEFTLLHGAADDIRKLKVVLQYCQTSSHLITEVLQYTTKIWIYAHASPGVRTLTPGCDDCHAALTLYWPAIEALCQGCC